MLDKVGIAKRIAQEVRDGMYINLGIGIPTLVANYIPKNMNVVLQSNWKVPGKMVKGMGGAMDLVASAKNIIVAMQHCSKEGASKLLRKCSLPITGLGCVKKIVSDLAVLDVLPSGGFRLLERAPGVSIEQIKNATEGKLIIDGNIPEMKLQ